MKKLNIFILIFLLGFGYGCSGIQSRKTISDISDISDETKAQVTIEDLEGQTVRTHVQNIDDNFDEIYALVDTGSANFTGMSGSVITSGTVADSYIASTIARDSEVTSAVSTKQDTLTNEAGLYSALSDVNDFVQPSEIDTAAELESVANLGAYASDILGCTNLAALMTLINGGAYSPTGALDFSGASSITSGPMAFSGTATLPETPSDGQLTQYTGGAIDLFTFYNGSAWNYFVATTTAPSNDGYIPVYRTATGIGWEAQSGGLESGSVAVSDMADSAVETSLEGLTDTDTAFPTSAAVYDEIATLTALVNALQTAVDNAGLNAFTFLINTPSSFPYYVSATTASFSDIDITDTNTSYDPDTLQYQVDSGGYTSNDCSYVTDHWECNSMSLTENASNTIQLQVCDDKTTPNCQESSEYTVVSDTTPPVGVADADGTHSGTGDSITSGIDWTETYLDTSTVTCTVVNATPTNPTITTVGNASDTEALTPDGTGTVTCTWAADDLAGNSATPVVQEFTYSGGASYTIEEYYEGTGYDGTPTPVASAGNGTVDPDYTTTVLQGSQSLNMIGGTSDNSTRLDWTLTSSITTFRYHILLRINTLPTSNSDILTFYNSSSTQIAKMQIQSTGRMTFAPVGVSTMYGSTLSTGTTYHIVIDGTVGTGSDGAMALYYGTSTTLPTTPDMSTTASTWDTDILTIRQSAGYAIDYVSDQALMSETQFTTVP